MYELYDRKSNLSMDKTPETSVNTNFQSPSNFWELLYLHSFHSWMWGIYGIQKIQSNKTWRHPDYPYGTYIRCFRTPLGLLLRSCPTKSLQSASWAAVWHFRHRKMTIGRRSSPFGKVTFQGQTVKLLGSMFMVKFNRVNDVGRLVDMFFGVNFS